MVYTGCWTGILIVGTCVLAALLLAELARWEFGTEALREGHTASGNLLAVVGTLYAVLLGLVVVDAMARFQQAMDSVQTESNCVADIYLLAARLPEPQRGRVQRHCRDYTRAVVDLEWPAMEQGRMSVDARLAAIALIRSLDDFEPEKESQKIIYPVILEQLRQLWDFRRDRARMVEFGIPLVEWGTLLVGAAVVVYFTGLFHVASRRLQRVITSLTALVIGLNLYLMTLFGYPFAGELSVSKRPFDLDLAIFAGAFDERPAHDAEQATGQSPPAAAGGGG